MTHPRKTIRDYVVTLLASAAIPGVGSHVYSNSSLAVKTSGLPAINVATVSEESEPAEVNSALLRRTLTLAVEITAKSTSDATIDDACDAIAEYVESAFSADVTLGGTAIDASLASTTFAADVSGEYPIGEMTLTFTVTYFG